MVWVLFQCLWCCPQHSPASTLSPTLQNSPQFAILISFKIGEAQQDKFDGDVGSAGKEQEELIRQADTSK